MKKVRVSGLLVCTALVLCLTGCPPRPPKETTTTEGTTEVTTTTTVVETELRKPTGAVTSDKFNDFSDMSFSYNGKKYTLGVTKLSELVDDGVPISNSSSDFDQVVDKQSSYYKGFSFDVIPYRSATMTVANYTDNDLPAKDCVISSFTLSPISELPEGVVTFNFPDLFTKDDVINSIGEPAQKSEFESNGSKFEIISYEQASDVYYGTRRYEYTFKDGVIDTISMSYIP